MLSSDLIVINEEIIREKGLEIILSNIKEVTKTASKTLKRLEEFDITVIKYKEDFKEIEQTIKDIKKELF